MSSRSGGDPIPPRSSVDCERLPGLSRRQTLVCARNVELMGSVRQGALAALEECREQFGATRWGCGTMDGLKAFGKLSAELGECLCVFVLLLIF